MKNGIFFNKNGFIIKAQVSNRPWPVRYFTIFIHEKPEKKYKWMLWMLACIFRFLFTVLCFIYLLYFGAFFIHFTMRAKGINMLVIPFVLFYIFYFWLHKVYKFWIVIDSGVFSFFLFKSMFRRNQVAFKHGDNIIL